MRNDFLLPFGPVTDSASEDLPPHLRRIGLRVYRQGWNAYDRAGCPFGVQDKAMMIWYSFNSRTNGPSLTVGKN